LIEFRTAPSPIVPAVIAALFCATFLVLLPVLVVAANEPHPGQAPYDKSCKVCHGPEGKGNAGPALVPFELDDEQLLARVREGGGEMPPFSERRVSDDEVKQIASYLRSLNPGTP
jgi:mono/diheme cytochrome c family protein